MHLSPVCGCDWVDRDLSLSLPKAGIGGVGSVDLVTLSVILLVALQPVKEVGPPVKPRQYPYDTYALNGGLNSE